MTDINKIAGIAAFGLPVLFAIGTLMTPPFVVPNGTLLLVVIGAIVGLLNVTGAERKWVAIISAVAAAALVGFTTYIAAFDVFGVFVETLFGNLIAVLAPVAVITILAELYTMLSKK